MSDCTFGDRVIYFNLAEHISCRDLFSACGGLLSWGTGQDVLNYHEELIADYYLVGSRAEGVARLWYSSQDCDSRTQSRANVVSSIIKAYDALGIRFGDFCVDKPLLVRDIVLALTDPSGDVDAVIKKHLGDILD